MMEDIVRGVAKANSLDTRRESCFPQDEENRGEEDDGSYSFHLGWMNNRKFIKQLQKDNIDLTLLRSELGQQNQHRRRKTWKEHLLHFLRSNPLQIVLSLLVLIDAAIVIAEIILEIHSLKSAKEAFQDQLQGAIAFLNSTFGEHLKYSNLSGYNNEIHDMAAILNLLAEQNFTCFSNYISPSSPPSSSSSTGSSGSSDRIKESSENHLPRLSSHVSAAAAAALSVFGGVSGGSRDRSPTSPRNDATSDNKWRQSAPHPASGGSSAASANAAPGGGAVPSLTPKQATAHTLHLVSEILHYTSIGILGFFVLEVSLKIVCLGAHFFKEKFEVVDAVVIITSFVADLVFVYVASNEISVMVIFLLWRIVRVINGLMMHEKQRDEFRITLQKKARRVSEMKVDHLSTQKEMQDKHILALEEFCRTLGGHEDQIKKCKPRYKKYTKQQTNNALKSIAALTTGFMGGLVGAQPVNNDQITKYTKPPTPIPEIDIAVEQLLTPNLLRKSRGSTFFDETPAGSVSDLQDLLLREASRACSPCPVKKSESCLTLQIPHVSSVANLKSNYSSSANLLEVTSPLLKNQSELSLCDAYDSTPTSTSLLLRQKSADHIIGGKQKAMFAENYCRTITTVADTHTVELTQSNFLTDSQTDLDIAKANGRTVRFRSIVDETSVSDCVSTIAASESQPRPQSFSSNCVSSSSNPVSSSTINTKADSSKLNCDLKTSKLKKEAEAPILKIDLNRSDSAENPWELRTSPKSYVKSVSVPEANKKKKGALKKQTSEKQILLKKGKT